jgi:hypothetical protein
MRSCGTDDAKPLLPHSTSFHEQAHEFEIWSIIFFFSSYVFIVYY